jgi:hypothetical protein
MRYLFRCAVILHLTPRARKIGKEADKEEERNTKLRMKGNKDDQMWSGRREEIQRPEMA